MFFFFSFFVFFVFLPHSLSITWCSFHLQAFNFWLTIPDEKLNVIADVVKMLHNSSLL